MKSSSLILIFQAIYDTHDWVFYILIVLGSCGAFQKLKVFKTYASDGREYLDIVTDETIVDLFGLRVNNS